MDKFFFIELFAGIGGVSQGFESHGGFEAIALTDVDLDSRDTYHENFTSTDYLVRDVRELTVGELRDATKGKNIHGVLGCPPCQGFSSLGKRDSTDERNRRIEDFLRIIRELHPNFFVFENVPSVMFNAIFRDFLSELNQAGYSIWSGILNAALYGLPQTRQRAIVIGIDKNLEVEPSPPPITHVGSNEVFDYASQRSVKPCSVEGFSALGFYPDTLRIETRQIAAGDAERLRQKSEEELAALCPVVTVEDALDDLPEPSRSQKEEPIPYGTEERQLTDYQIRMRAGSKGVSSHTRRTHKSENVAKWSQIRAGGNLAGKREDRYFSQAYGRLHPQGLARTITGGFLNPGCGRFLHYNEHRSITIREAARLHPKVRTVQYFTPCLYPSIYGYLHLLFDGIFVLYEFEIHPKKLHTIPTISLVEIPLPW